MASLEKKSQHTQYLEGFYLSASDGESVLPEGIAMALGILDYAKSRRDGNATPRSRNSIDAEVAAIMSGGAEAKPEAESKA